MPALFLFAGVNVRASGRAATAIWWAPIVIIGVYVAVWHSLYPPVFDDIAYTRRFLEPRPEFPYHGAFYLLESCNETVGEALRSFWNHYLYVNGRTCHIFAYLMPLTPAWVQGIADGIVMSLFVWLLMKLIALMKAQGGESYRARDKRGKRENNREAVPAWMVAVIVAALPWLLVMSERMMSRDFFINYYWSSVAALAFMLIWFGRDDRGPTSPAKCVLFFILGFFAGSMHEMWGLSLFAAVAGTMLFKWQFPRVAWRRWLLLGLFLGVVLGSLSVSNIGRALVNNNIPGFIKENVVTNPAIFFNVSLAVKAGLAVGVISLLTRAGRSMLSSGLGIGSVIVFFTCIVFAIMANGSRRAMLPAACITIAYIAAFALRIVPTLNRPSRGVAAAVSLLLAFWFGSVLTVQARMAPRHWQFYNNMMAAEKKVVEEGGEVPRWMPMDLPEWGDAPWWANGMPSLLGYNGDWINRYSHFVVKDTTRLTGFGSWAPTPGNTPLLGDGPFYIPGDKLKSGESSIDYIATLGPPAPCMRPWRRLNAPDTISVRVTFDVWYPMYCITPEGDTVHPMMNDDFGEMYGRYLIRLDTIPANYER